MKKVMIFVAAGVLASALYASPAEDQAAALKAQQEQMLKKLQEQLGLSDAQTKKWGEIQSRYMEEHMKLQVEQTKEINALMNDDQRKKFEELQRQYRERLMERMGKK